MKNELILDIIKLKIKALQQIKLKDFETQAIST